ncbi:MAG TPA: DUF3343 domain-containing protein [Smithellaceae bacterium]|jgi:hypothetical protein|nr:DUF3343 domain-containing protein [Smithellaceae bacterium]HQC20040.1 DUF3343 domain-containing protein [Smithella sp.]HOF77173.1 DUF3343 domain-containing protein [Smithellaceae bacterium]HOM70467.1 DUF3343 domain-containing protein [Smithellaceae bacterium]HOS08285.1 DUF3343 domain-containing protein [Smithellaceae bacterium]
MSGSPSYCVMLFKSVSYVLKAEKILKKENLPHKLIPVPKKISSDCGVCLRFEPNMREKIEAALFKKVEIEEICKLCEQ